VGHELTDKIVDSGIPYGLSGKKQNNSAEFFAIIPKEEALTPARFVRKCSCAPIAEVPTLSTLILSGFLR
jgi:hypothetical protein